MSETPFEKENIAIIGMGCLFPGAENVEQYWHNIVHKIDHVGGPPPDWRPESLVDGPGNGLDTATTGRGGFLGDLCRFEPKKYGIMPNATDGAEPDQFIALRCAFEAFEDAGHPGINLNKDRTGVILGRGTYINRGLLTVLHHGHVLDQVLNVLGQLLPDNPAIDLAALRREMKENLPPFGPETVPGLCHSVMVGRIANRLDLHGPAFTVDAACSSSLLAVDMAMRELRSGRCDACLAGGVQVSTPAVIDLMFCHLDALSRTGTIKPFSAHANGTLLGEGCGILLLKRQSDAERDGNRIYAVLKSVGMSSDGRATGILAPNSDGQAIAIRQAYDQAGLSPDTIGLVEAHGTGIPLGDKTEIISLSRIFGPRINGRSTVALGSVKSMISHLIPAAGAAALIKTALALYHRVLPPTLHAEEPNPILELEKTRFFLNTNTRPWIHGDRENPRRAAVDAFGFGGTNTHCILEEYAPPDEAAQTDLDRYWPAELVVVSASGRNALRERVQELDRWLQRASSAGLIDVAAACARETGGARVAICATSIEDLQKKLKKTAERLADENRSRIQDRGGVFYYDAPLAKEGKVAFVFPGEGSQYPGMLSDLCRHFPEVRRQFDLAEAAFQTGDTPRTLSRAIFPLADELESAEHDLYAMEWAVESVTASNRALFALMAYLGVKPNGILGHSSGEFTALLAAGAVNMKSDDELIEAIRRGAACNAKLQSSDLVPKAALITVGGADLNVVEQTLSAYEDVVVALDNCPHQMVLAGKEEALFKVRDALAAEGALCEVLPWGRAYHTEAFAPACAVIGEYYDTMQFQQPAVEMWSCATAQRYPAGPEAIKELVTRQWRSKVRFRETIQQMHNDGYRVFLEVGPRGNLTAFLNDTLKKQPHAAIPLNLYRQDDMVQLCTALAMLAAHGVPFDLEKLYARRQPREIDLAGAPPEPPRPAPILKKALPELKLETGTAQRVRQALAGGQAPETYTGAAGPAFVEFQQTMQQFLQVQERVMKSHLRATPPAQPAASEAAPLSAPTGAAHPLETETAPESPAKESGPATSMLDTLLTIVSERTGYPGDMLELDIDLEADLGIDSIKRVEIIAAFRKKAVPSLLEPPDWFIEAMSDARTLGAILQGVAKLVSSAIGAGGPEVETAAPANLLETLREIVSERTGYPVDMLELDIDIESELGIDSIKRVEIIAAFRRQAVPKIEEPPEWFREAMSEARTLGAILDGITALSNEPGAPAKKTDVDIAGFSLWKSVVEHTPGEQISVECELDAETQPFLIDHAFGNTLSTHDPALRPLIVMPLAMTMELMAQAAALLSPQSIVARMRDVQTLSWLDFAAPARRVRVIARRAAPLVYDVTVVEADRENAPIHARAIVEFEEQPLDLGTDRTTPSESAPHRWSPDRLYTDGLFHGPAFRVIEAIEVCTDTTVEAIVRGNGHPLLKNGNAALLLPVAIIDAIGQAIGFWCARETLEMSFPTGLRKIEFGRPQNGNEALRLTGNILGENEGRIHSDLKVVDEAGNVIVRVSGRTDQEIPLPKSFWRYRVNPKETAFSRHRKDLFASAPGIEHCVVTQLEDFGGAVLLEMNGVWSLNLSRYVLDRGERRRFDELTRPPASKAAWLLGRTAAKDAVRIFTGEKWCLADFRIDSDQNGAPAVAADHLRNAPLVSFAHSGFSAMALAVDPERVRGAGIDIECGRELDAAVLEDAYSANERDQIRAWAASSGLIENKAFLAAWCAKEALAKALGCGLLGGPRNVVINSIESGNNSLSMSVQGNMLEHAIQKWGASIAGKEFRAYVETQSGTLAAVCLIDK